MKTVKQTKDGYVAYEPKNEKPNFPQFALKATTLKSTGETKLEYATKVMRSDYYLEVESTYKVKVLTGDTLKKSTDAFNHHVQLQRLHAKVVLPKEEKPTEENEQTDD